MITKYCPWCDSYWSPDIRDVWRHMDNEHSFLKGIQPDSDDDFFPIKKIR